MCPSIHPSMSFDASKTNSATASTTPLGNMSYLRPFCLHASSTVLLWIYTSPQRGNLKLTVWCRGWCSRQQDMTGSLGTDSQLAQHKEPCHVPRNALRACWTVSSCHSFSICSVPNLLMRPGCDLPHYISMVIGWKWDSDRVEDVHNVKTRAYPTEFPVITAYLNINNFVILTAHSMLGSFLTTHTLHPHVLTSQLIVNLFSFQGVICWCHENIERLSNGTLISNCN